MTEKQITALVVFVGILCLSGAAYLRAPQELLAAGASVLLLLAGSLRSMLSSGGLIAPKDGDK